VNALITALALLAVAFWLGASYRRLLRLRARVASAWRHVDDSLWQRHEVIGVIAETATQAAVSHDVLNPFVKMYQRGIAHRKPSEAARLRKELEGALARVVDALRSSGGDAPAFGHTLQRLQESETALVAANAVYEQNARAYNDAIAAMPGNLIASMAGYRRAEPF
jgi:LemA protein